MSSEEQAERLEWIAAMMTRYAQVLRGEREDLTGLGEWQIIVQNLEMVMDVKVLTKEQYENFLFNHLPKSLF